VPTYTGVYSPDRLGASNNLGVRGNMLCVQSEARVGVHGYPGAFRNDGIATSGAEIICTMEACLDASVTCAEFHDVTMLEC
jgi:hypothetical protein